MSRVPLETQGWVTWASWEARDTPVKTDWRSHTPLGRGRGRGRLPTALGVRSPAQASRTPELPTVRPDCPATATAAPAAAPAAGRGPALSPLLHLVKRLGPERGVRAGLHLCPVGEQAAGAPRQPPCRRCLERGLGRDGDTTQGRLLCLGDAWDPGPPLLSWAPPRPVPAPLPYEGAARAPSSLQLPLFPRTDCPPHTARSAGMCPLHSRGEAGAECGVRAVPGSCS